MNVPGFVSNPIKSRVHSLFHPGGGANESADRYPFLPGRGSLLRRLIMFALPVIGAGVVQQSFNSVDVAVVGQYVGDRALAAVGATGSVISLIITLLMGIALGVNVLIARYLGAGDKQGARRAVSTQAIVCAICSIILLAIGLSIARPILELLDTPREILPSATTYLRIYALGFPAMMVYNFVSAVMRGIGNTRRPFLWLVAGGLVNVVLNLFLVLVGGMEVEGVAIATVVSNIVSAIGITYDLMRAPEPIRLHLRHLRVYARELRIMLAIGLPAGLQGSVFALSNVIIQSAVNSFGAKAMAGSAAALVFELYGYFVISAFVQAALTFVSAAYGAGEYKLCKRLMWICMALGAIGSAIVNLSVSAWALPCCMAFTADANALQYAVMRVHIVLTCQFIACSYEIAGGGLRALGYSLTPMFITIIGTCLLRISWVKVYVPQSFSQLMSIYPITWVVTGIAMLLAWHIITRKTLRIEKK